jgi:hypothetical protein
LTKLIIDVPRIHELSKLSPEYMSPEYTGGILSGSGETGEKALLDKGIWIRLRVPSTEFTFY